jgi:hypothetical protein
VTRPGSFPLRLDLVHANRAIYTQQWTFEVGDGGSVVNGAARNTPIEQAPLPAVSLTEPPRRPYRLLFVDRDGSNCFRRRAVPSMAMRRAVWIRSLTASGREKRCAILLTISKAAPHSTPSVLLSFCGRWQSGVVSNTRRSSAPNRRASKGLREALEQIGEGSTLTVDTDAVALPWHWLYMGDPYAPANPNDAVGWRNFVSGFWGVRWELEIPPRTSKTHIGMQWQLVNRNSTILSAGVNMQAFPESAVQHRKLIGRGVGSVIGNIYEGRDGVLAMLKQAGAAVSSPASALSLRTPCRG